MQFLWKYIEDLVGKGLELSVIVELFVYASASLVSMALPLAILLSSIMTFGNLGENYELVSMKSAGISLQRIMRPLIGFCIGLSALAFYFSNNVLPMANLKFKSLLFDVMHQKPAMDFKPGVFYKGIEGFVIRISGKEKDGQTLRDVMIYDHREQGGNEKVISAKTGKISMSEDGRYLIFNLYDGYQYDEQKGRTNPLARSEFKEHTMNFDLSGFSFSRTDEDLFKDNQQMLNINQLGNSLDSLNKVYSSRQSDYKTSMSTRLQLVSDTVYKKKAFSKALPDTVSFNAIEGLTDNEKRHVYQTATNLTRAAKTYALSMGEELKSRRKKIALHNIEWHRKFVLSISCLILFFIGAPMGAIIRKGGLGMPVVVSVVFFLVYHISGLTGEKMVKEGALIPGIGMWLSTFVLAPIGAFLTYKSTTDSMILDATFYSKLFEPIAKLFSPIVKLFTEKKKKKH